MPNGKLSSLRPKLVLMAFYGISSPLSRSVRHVYTFVCTNNPANSLHVVACTLTDSCFSFFLSTGAEPIELKHLICYTAQDSNLCSLSHKLWICRAGRPPFMVTLVSSQIHPSVHLHVSSKDCRTRNLLCRM